MCGALPFVFCLAVSSGGVLSPLAATSFITLLPARSVFPEVAAQIADMLWLGLNQGSAYVCVCVCLCVCVCVKNEWKVFRFVWDS